MSSSSKTSAEENLKKWLNLNQPAHTRNSDFQKLPGNQAGPLSFGQLRLWFLQQLNPGNPFYHYAESFQIKGPLNRELLISSFKELINRHQILRTTFPDKEGIPWQQIHRELLPEITYHDLGAVYEKHRKFQADQNAREEARKPFNLQTGPLVRLSLFSLNDKEHFMVLTMHHMIIDKWSMDILRKEWIALYLGQSLPPINEIQYADFAYDQRQKPPEKPHLSYWTNKLAGEIPKLKLPTIGKTSMKKPAYRGSFSEARFSEAQSVKLQQLCKRTNSTIFVLMLSVFKVLLYRYTGETDLLVATPISNRDRISLEDLIGFFNETLVLRTGVSGHMKFTEVLEQVQNTVLEAFDHKNIPFETLVQKLKPERLVSSNPLFQVMFLYHKVQPADNNLTDQVNWEYRPFDLGISKFDLTLYISEENGGLSAIFEYPTDLFDESTIVRMHGHLRCLIDGILKDPDRAISKLPFLTSQERKMILDDWNKPVEVSTEYTSITAWIDSTIQKYANRSAVVCAGLTMSYARLDERANKLARVLLEAGSAPNDRIGICSERSAEMIIGILAVLKIGAAYVPLDPKYPLSRLQFIIADAGIDKILVQDHLMDQLPTGEFQSIGFNTRIASDEVKAHGSPDPISGTSIAYVIYTSGSTGTPKGVAVTHKNLLHSTQARLVCYQEQPGNFLLMSSLGFDSSVAGIFWTLVSGGTLIIPEESMVQDMEMLSELIAVNRVTHTLLLPSLYNLLLTHGTRQNLTSLNTVIVAGEVCPGDVCRNHFESLHETRLYNEYGPSEATVWCTVHQINPDDSHDSIPIGRPVQNTEIYILDENQQPVPAGVIGEVYVGGAGVVPGYLNQPGLTEKRFVKNPFSNDPSSRLYRTGDLARFRSDGVIEFWGREDRQIKVRGYRIELDEIERVIGNYPGIGEVALALKQHENDPVLTDDAISDIVSVLQEMDRQEAEELLDSVETIKHFNSPGGI